MCNPSSRPRVNVLKSRCDFQVNVSKCSQKYGEMGWFMQPDGRPFGVIALHLQAKEAIGTGSAFFT
jgi:hypothetical protein